MKKLSLVLFLLSASPALFAQPVDDVILRAMRDEMQRSLNELKAPGYDKPFFIMYGLHDVRIVSISASMGAIVSASDHRMRTRATSRVLVGDYGFNDESLEDDLTSAPTAMDLPLPIDDDYDGIRRSFWSITDNVYREAAKHYKEHQESLKELGKTIQEVVHREFAKSPPVNLIHTEPPVAFDRNAWEQRLRRLSARLSSKPEVTGSGVSFMFVSGYEYLVSSEGSMIKTPVHYCTVTFSAGGKEPDDELSFNQIVRTAFTPDRLPDEAALAADADLLIKEMSSGSSVELEETYTGPILFTGQAVVDLISANLLGRGSGLSASNQIPSSRPTRFSFDLAEAPSEAKIGKKITHESITIKAKPKLKSWNNVDLVGSFEVDPEGIVPPDELVLVEKGILVNQMNDRTLVGASQKANGFRGGAGVLEVTCGMKDSEAALRKKLVQAAKKEGLAYGLIVRRSSFMGLAEVYRVNVSDGKEVRIKSARIIHDGARSFRRILGATGTLNAYSTSPGMFELTPSAPASMIVPTAILVEDGQVQQFRMPRMNQKDYVESPLRR